MPQLYRTTFDTALGTCGVAWSDDGVLRRFQLPPADPAGDQAGWVSRRLARDLPDAVPVDADDLEDTAPDIAKVVAAVQQLMNTGQGDLRWVPVALDDLEPFARQVYEQVREIPAGQTLTYGEVAAAVGRPGGAQAVGAAMGSNPVPVVVPCHRVVGADGRMVGFSAPGGAATKRRLLDVEGAAVVAQRTLF